MYLREIDQRVSSIKIHLEKTFDDVDLVIIGDHGMTNVHRRFDVNKRIIQALKK